MKQYRPAYVVLHWVSAILVLLAFVVGLFSLANTPNDEAKRLPLGVHVALGVGILVLTVARLIVRALMGRPVHQVRRPDGKLPLIDLLSIYVQPLLYLFTLLMATVGVWLAIPSDLFNILFLEREKSLPPDFYAYPARVWHGTLSLALMLLIGQHILAFVYHQFLRGENFIGRMWFSSKRKN